MHALVAAASLLVVAGAGYGALAVLPRVGGWRERRDLQLLVLSGPTVSLALGLVGLHHFSDHLCYLDTPPLDDLIALALPVAAALIALGGLAAGIVRLAMVELLVARLGTPAPSGVTARVVRLAARFGIEAPRVRLCADGFPAALVCGVGRPTIVVSAWVVEHLDDAELEAVLAHELAHLVRRDYLVTWLATVLRDAFCYLPPSRAAYRLLQREKELACDDLAVSVTDRPLALASALARVWQRQLASVSVGGAQTLTGSPVEDRIVRLLERGRVAAPVRLRLPSAALITVSLAALAVCEVAVIVVAMLPMGCLPIGLALSL